MNIGVKTAMVFTPMIVLGGVLRMCHVPHSSYYPKLTATTLQLPDNSG